MKDQVKVGIVVVSYHNPDMTARFINEELVKIHVPYTLVVVNNDSTPEDCRQLAERVGLCLADLEQPVSVADRYILCSRENLGYAKGNNLGVEFLRKVGSFTHYLFSNDDIELKSQDVLERLISSMELHPDVACVGPRVVGKDGRDQSPHHSYVSPLRQIGWKLFSFMRKRKKGGAVSLDRPAEGYAYWVSGAFMLCKADAFSKVDGFDPATFLYFEEVILAERLKKIQGKVYFEPAATILHYEGNSTADTPSEAKRKIEMDSRMHYYRHYKNEPSLSLWLYGLICK